MQHSPATTPGSGLGRILERFLHLGWWLPLLVPSLWLWANIPPLWRDLDGFNQVTAEIGGLTLLLWPPLYCLLARVPLALGAWWEKVSFSFNEPTLTDSGVALLIGSQHLLLAASFAWFIAVIARRDGTRLFLSAAFAGVAAFQVFAHTVGTESLSVTAQFALLAGVALILRENRPRLWPWVGYAALLAIAILTRHVNAVLAALLPVAFLLRAAIDFVRSGRGGEWKAAARRAGFAVLAGVAAIVTVNLTVRVLCAVADTPYHSKVGYVFQWRTAFIASKSPAEQTAFFDAVCARLSDPLAVRALRAYETALQTGKRPDTDFLSEFVKGNLKEDSSLKRRTRLVLTAKTLNRIAVAILTSAPPGYAGAVVGDFQKNFAASLAVMTREPASSTQFFVGALTKPEFQKLRGLVTFRNGYYLRAVPDFAKHPYLAAGKTITIAGLAVVAIVLWLASLAIPCREGWQTVYPPTLLAVGALLMFLNCCTTFFMPRFGLPLLGTTMAALCIPVACALDGLGAWIGRKWAAR